MLRLAAFVTEHRRPAWIGALAAVCVAGTLAAWLVRDLGEAERLSRLEVDAGRGGVEIMSQTLNGNIMGALSALSMMDDGLRRDAQHLDPANNPRALSRLENVGRAYAAEGVFVVGQDGIVASSWDSSGKPSTGLNVRFRPYFQMARQGKENIYAAVSLARGDRALYFASPVWSGAQGSESVGAVVARTTLDRVDSLMGNRADVALLLSPQGVVFAGNRAEWIGFLAGAATPERLKAIRDLKQFGTMFDKVEPRILPFPVETGVVMLDGRRHALASARVRWNDPFGDWSLVLLEDLTRTVPLSRQVAIGAAIAAVLLLIGTLVLKLLGGHHVRTLALARIAQYASEQEEAAARKSRLAEAARRFQRAKSVDELASVFLRDAHDMVGALQGTVYVGGSTGTLRLAGSFAAAADVAHDLEPGEGLLGQCVLDRRPRLIELPTDGTWTIRSGLGNGRPAAVLMAPLVLDEAVLGVVEIGLLSPPDSILREQFDEMVALVALNLEILRHMTEARQ